MPNNLEDFLGVSRLFIPLMAAMATAWSLFQLFFGYRYYRVVAVLKGIIIGALLGWGLGLWLVPGQPLLLYLAALIGMAIIAPCFYYISVFAVGFSASALLALVLGGLLLLVMGAATTGSLQASLESPDMIVKILLAIVGLVGIAGGILAVRYHRMVIIVLTSLSGAVTGVQAVGLVALSSASGSASSRSVAWWIPILLIALVVALTVLGIWMQRKGLVDEPAAGRPKRRTATAATARG